MDLNDVKAGKYQLVAVRWDQITSKPGEPLDYVRHRRGDVVDLNTEDAKRLVAAGAVVKPGQLEKSAVEQARALAERAQRDYEAALAGLPEDVRTEVAPATVPNTGSDGSSTDSTDGGSKEPTVKEILDGVGDDAAKAQAALDEERARGDKARKTLVEPLEAVIAKAGSGS